MIITVITALCTAALAAICVWMISRSKILKLQMEVQTKDILHQSEMKANSELLKREKENYERALKEMKETVVTSMTAETEKLLRAREKELKEGNQTNMDGIIKPLKESISAMERP